MFDLSRRLEQTGETVEARLRKTEHSEILRLRRADGRRFVLRIYDRAVPAYGALQGVRCAALPEVYACWEEDGAFLVEEEFVDGVTLQSLLETYRPDDVQTAAIAARVCDALEVLHAHGVVHRDVKPKNVLLTAAGRVVLIDLDAAAALDPGKDADTRLLGTPGYAAPEQFGFSRSDARTDVFALGVMMNVMRTGEHPARRLLTGPLRRAVERCIHVNADRRFASAALLRAALPRPAGTSAPCPDCGAVTPGGGCLCCGRPSGKRLRARRRWLWPLAAAAVLILVAALVLLSRTSETPEPGPVPAPNPAPVTPPAATETPAPTPLPTPAVTDDPLQLYYKYGDLSYETTYANPAGGGSWLPLFYRDAAGDYVALTRDDTLTCDEGFGKVHWRGDLDCWEWVVFDQIPGQTGTLYADVGGTRYHMDCTIAMADLGVYDRVPDSAAPGMGFLSQARETVTVPAGQREVWLVLSDDFFFYGNWRITALDVGGLELEQLWNGQLLHLTLPEGADLKQALTVCIDDMTRNFFLQFTEIS